MWLSATDASMTATVGSGKSAADPVEHLEELLLRRIVCMVAEPVDAGGKTLLGDGRRERARVPAGTAGDPAPRRDRGDGAAR